MVNMQTFVIDAFLGRVAAGDKKNTERIAEYHHHVCVINRSESCVYVNSDAVDWDLSHAFPLFPRVYENPSRSALPSNPMG